jgi:hypothetical protein
LTDKSPTLEIFLPIIILYNIYYSKNILIFGVPLICLLNSIKHEKIRSYNCFVAILSRFFFFLNTSLLLRGGAKKKGPKDRGSIRSRANDSLQTACLSTSEIDDFHTINVRSELLPIGRFALGHFHPDTRSTTVAHGWYDLQDMGQLRLKHNFYFRVSTPIASLICYG